MLLIFLGVLDLLAGAILALHPFLAVAGSGYIAGIAILFFLKGLYSLLTAFAVGFYFDLLGLFDIAGGVFLALLYFGVASEFFVYIGLAVLLKGIYSFVMGMVEIR